MFKQFFILAFIAFSVMRQSHARLNLLASSTSFEEPRGGFGRLIALKDGSTAFVYISVKEGIQVRLYNQEHKEAAVAVFEPSYGKLRLADVPGIFEINGNIVLFVSQVTDHQPVLFRFLIDGKNGKLIREDKIAAFKKIDTGRGYAEELGRTPLPGFAVRKDPVSDHYAVAITTSFISGGNEKIELIYYNREHEQLSRAAYQSPDNRYKYLRYFDLCLFGEEVVALLGAGSSRNMSGGRNGPLVLATLKAGATQITIDSLDYPEAATVNNALLRYNKATNQLMLLASHEQDGLLERQYRNYLAVINPGDHAVKLTMLSTAAIQEIADDDRKKGIFIATPQNLFIRDDGSYSVFYEEIDARTEQQYTTGWGNNNSMVLREKLRVVLGDVGVVRYTASGREQGSFYFPKQRNVYALPIVMYSSDREEKAAELSQTYQFLYGYYLNGVRQDYVFCNNQRRGEKGRRGKSKSGAVISYEDCTAYGYRIGGEEKRPEEEFVFGVGPEAEKYIGLFQTSAYDRDRNVMVTLKRAQKGRSEPVQLVWLQPD